MVLNKRTETEVSELLANARETVARLENTTTKMHEIINEDNSVRTRSPTANRIQHKRSGSTFVTKIIAFLLAWIVVLCSFLSISFYYFAQTIHESVHDLSKQVVDIQKVVAKPIELPPVVVTWPAGNLPPPTDGVATLPSRNSAR